MVCTVLGVRKWPSTSCSLVSWPGEGGLEGRRKHLQPPHPGAILVVCQQGCRAARGCELSPAHSSICFAERSKEQECFKRRQTWVCHTVTCKSRGLLRQNGRLYACWLGRHQATAPGPLEPISSAEGSISLGIFEKKVELNDL